MAFPATAVRFPGAAQRVNGDGAVRPATSRSRRHGIRDITAQLPAARKTTRHGQSWDVDEARTFLESAYADRDPLYPLWVLILVLGLRKGEAQGLVWPLVDLDNAEISLEWQVQRVGRELIHKQQLKTDESTDVLPLPDICLAAREASA